MKKLFIILCYFFGSPFIIIIYFVLIYFFNKDYLKCFGNNVYSKQILYRNSNGSVVILIPMMHIAEKEFYENIKTELNKCSVILTEGVNDSEKLLDGKINYGALAKYIALEAQQPFKTANIVNADDDVNNFSKDTLNGIKTIQEVFKNIDIYGIRAGIAKTENVDVIKNMDMSEILDVRNDILKKCFISLKGDQTYIREKVQQHEEMIKAIDSFNELGIDKQIICIPWGAKHITFLEKMVCSQGYKLYETKYHKLFSLISIIYEVMARPLKSKYL